jgi:hypothetical protein
LYWYNGDFKLWNNGDWNKIGKGIKENDNGETIYIVHNEKIDYKAAIYEVFHDIPYFTPDIIDICNSFVPANQRFDINCKEYDDLKGSELDVNPRFRHNVKISNSVKLSCQIIKKVIMGRGNNDGKCCCCGKIIEEDENGKNKGKLIITKNTNPDTCSEYPQITEVVCPTCERVLRRSHKKTELVQLKDGFEIDYCCIIQNSAQMKEIHFKTKVYDGILTLDRKITGNGGVV